MAYILFRDAAVLDPVAADVEEGYEVAIEGEVIREVSDRPVTARSAERYDLEGRVMMPGPIDSHVHVMPVTTNLAQLA